MCCTQQLGHHACCTCEVNGFVQIPSLHACCTHVACTSSYSFLMLVQYNIPLGGSGSSVTPAIPLPLGSTFSQSDSGVIPIPIPFRCLNGS